MPPSRVSESARDFPSPYPRNVKNRLKTDKKTRNIGAIRDDIVPPVFSIASAPLAASTENPWKDSNKTIRRLNAGAETGEV